ncbi:MAG: hypothetical protein BIFFINMI_03266 [Phycisphaerae bacterium]|nr:hypothetical protein [Phycisphaerae bacterium]
MIGRRFIGGRRHGFTLIELMVTVAVLALLMGILLPSLSAAREAARVTTVRCELRKAADALENYGLDNRDRWPPMRTSCDAWNLADSGQLPVELARGRYLPAGDEGSSVACGLPDRYSPGHAYKYACPGPGFHNDAPVNKSLFVPDAFPHDACDGGEPAGAIYNNATRPRSDAGEVIPCPVAWVVYSVGPRYDATADVDPYGPVARRSWYRGFGTGGLIALIRCRDGRFVCSQ